MNKNRVLRTILLSTVFALLVGVLLTSTVNAQTAVPAHGAASEVPAAFPNANIVRTHGKSVFSPTTVHCKARGLKKTCYTITNTTNKTQRILFRGKTLATIPPGNTVGIGVSRPGLAFAELQSNPQAVLTVQAT
jgi:hypothetical protein